MGKKVLKLYTPHSIQLAMHQSPKRFKVFAAGRQVGKSTFSNMEMLKKAWEKPKTRYAFISPIYSQAKEQYRRLIQCIPKTVIKKNSDTELRVELINGSIMEYCSGDNPDSLRGKTLDGVLVDEVRDQSPELWSKILRPMLATTKGWAIFSSTPNGFDSFFDLAEQAKIDNDWELFKGPSTCNPLFTQEEFEAAKAQMSEAVFAQEILAEFRDLQNGLAYINFSKINQTTHNPFGRDLFSPYLPIIIGMDFNLSPMCWLIGQQRNEDFWFFDEVFLERSHTQEAALELAERLQNYKTLSKVQAILVGDASGKAGQRAAMGRSDLSIVEEILTQKGIRYENKTSDSNPLVSDRVNLVNSKLKDANGQPHIFIHSLRCARLVRDLQRVTWKAGANSLPKLNQTSDTTLTHMSDAMGYLVCTLSNNWIRSTGGLRILERKF